MDELLKIACVVPAILILMFAAAVLILTMNALFIFVGLCTRLTQRILKIIDEKFLVREDKDKS